MSPAKRAGIIIGSFGVLLSLYNTWRQWWSERPHVRVELQRHTAVLSRRIFLEARFVNHGRRTVVVRDVGFVVRREPLKSNAWSENMTGPEDFPFDLEPGRAASIAIVEVALIEALKQCGQSGRVDVRACCWDQLDNLYRSKPMTVEV
ncbi:MAG: hypothetical protein M3Q71_09840 [Chloroflexota bacterium]|nr:hypothetical protein [Chloroflexota bacterium]